MFIDDIDPDTSTMRKKSGLLYFHDSQGRGKVGKKFRRGGGGIRGVDHHEPDPFCVLRWSTVGYGGLRASGPRDRSLDARALFRFASGDSPHHGVPSQAQFATTEESTEKAGLLNLDSNLPRSNRARGASGPATGLR